MKLELNKKELEEFYHYLDTKETNISVADLFNDICFSLDQFNELKNINNLSNIDRINVIKNIFYNYFELDDSNPSNIEIINRYINDNIQEINVDKFNDNPYKKAVNIKEINENGYKLHYLNYPAYSFFPLDDIKVIDSDYYKEENILGFMNKEYQYLTLSKSNNVWMCITPNEMMTMSKAINEAKGNVITFGLGLGYYPFMVSLKENVKKITIIEKDKNIINLFKTYLLPHFPYKDKINIIETDAFKYIEINKLNDYDYAFFDLWHNAEDGLPIYIKINRENINIKKSFWIEESLISMYRRIILTVMEESLSGYNDDDYRTAKNDIDRIINELYFKTKNIRLKSIKDIHQFLSKDDILKLIRNK